MGGKALVMFSPPPPPAPPPKKALPVEHAVSSGKLLRESVIEVVKSSTSPPLVCGAIFLALQLALSLNCEQLGGTVLERIKWNSKPPPPLPQIKDEAAQKPKRTIFPSLI